MYGFLPHGFVFAFRYFGGSKPNSLRRVYVCAEKQNGFGAWDFDKEDFRQFNHDKIGDCFFLDGGVIDISKEDTAKEIATALERDGYQTFYDSVNGKLAYTPAPPEPEHSMSVRSNGETVTVRFDQNKGPNFFDFSLGPNTIKIGDRTVTVAELSQGLSDFVAGESVGTTSN